MQRCVKSGAANYRVGVLGTSGRRSFHLAFYPMHGSGADAEFLRGSENTRARRQLRPDSLNHFGTHGATLEPLRLAQRPRKGSFDS
jgi:hypothetical protein